MPKPTSELSIWNKSLHPSEHFISESPLPCAVVEEEDKLGCSWDIWGSVYTAQVAEGISC